MCSPTQVIPPDSMRAWPSAATSPVFWFTVALSAMSVETPYWTKIFVPMAVPEAMSYSTLPSGAPGMTWFCPSITQPCSVCARTATGKSMAKRTGRKMAALRRAGVLTGTDSREPWLVSGCMHVTLATATQAGALVIRRGQLNKTKRACRESKDASRKPDSAVSRHGFAFDPSTQIYSFGKKANATAATMHTNAARWFHRILSPKYRKAKTQKTVSVMISWMILSWKGE